MKGISIVELRSPQEARSNTFVCLAMITLASTSLLLAGIAAAAPPAPTWRTGQAVKTTSGTVVGHSSTWMPGVSEYLGIPYALPPTGDLRFAAPKKYTGNSTLGAHKFSPDCPANVQSPPGSKITYSSVAVTVGGMIVAFNS